MVITINLISILKFYLLGSVFSLVGFFVLMDKEYFKSKWNYTKGRQDILISILLCILYSWLNLYWIYVDITQILSNYYSNKNMYLISSIFQCLSDKCISKIRILRVYYNNCGYYIRVRKHYYNSYRLKNTFEYFDIYDNCVEDRFVNIYIHKNKLFKRKRGNKYENTK